jgi:hypothetical protein
VTIARNTQWSLFQVNFAEPVLFIPAMPLPAYPGKHAEIANTK